MFLLDPVFWPCICIVERQGGGDITELRRGKVWMCSGHEASDATRLDWKLERGRGGIAKPKFVTKFSNRISEEDGLLCA